VKKLIGLLAVFLLSQSAFALKVRDVSYDAVSDSLVVKVRYEGGCLEHRFRLRFANWHRASPRGDRYMSECEASIEDITAKTDTCARWVNKTIVFGLSDLDSRLRPVTVSFHVGSELPSVVVQVPPAPAAR
jgi:hypothetical protein